MIPNCAPVQCCCKGPWSIGPGETLPMLLDWSRWLASVPGYNLNAVASAALLDMNVNPPAPANPAEIAVVSGQGDDPDPPDNSDVAELVSLMPPTVTQALFSVGADTAIGRMYRFNIAVTARDCDGRKITMQDCVMVVVQQC
jgi:hypothetical protein